MFTLYNYAEHELDTVEIIALFKVPFFNIKSCKKKDVNRDSHIASSPISQSSFFQGVSYLILPSSQRKLRGYIEFL